jgi:hypothetical protein
MDYHAKHAHKQACVKKQVQICVPEAGPSCTPVGEVESPIKWRESASVALKTDAIHVLITIEPDANHASASPCATWTELLQALDHEEIVPPVQQGWTRVWRVVVSVILFAGISPAKAACAALRRSGPHPPPWILLIVRVRGARCPLVMLLVFAPMHPGSLFTHPGSTLLTPTLASLVSAIQLRSTSVSTCACTRTPQPIFKLGPWVLRFLGP